MNQNFSSRELLKLCRKLEWEDYHSSKEELENEINSNFSDIINNSFNFSIEKNGDYYLTNVLSHKLIIRKLNDNIKRLYKDEQSNRRLIIKQIITLLSENYPMWILRTDIEKFYESINRNILLAKLYNDAILSFHSLSLIKEIFDHPLLRGSNGLPRGLSISSTLSELYMRSFDKWISQSDGVYYYARFVDDIIVFSYNEHSIKKLNQEINQNLEKGLNKKIQKTGIFNGESILQNRPLEYLGYMLTTSTHKNKKSLEISIAKKKIKKIKTRIINSFLDFFKSNDFVLLEKRIRFLTGNFSVKKNSEGKDLMAGIYYNYPYLTDMDILDELNLFLRKVIHSKKGNFGFNCDILLDNDRKRRLEKYSFKHGFLNRAYHSFTPEEINEIKNCWK